jgi:uncharacterized membrane protein SirB2
MDYLALKAIHRTVVVLSFAGFMARGIGALAEAAWVRRRLAKTLPHVVDSVLLLSAIAMVWQLQLNPATTPWLLVKILGLLVYIGLGMLALRKATAQPLRAVAFVAALVTYCYIASVAISKNPAGFFTWVA